MLPTPEFPPPAPKLALGLERLAQYPEQILAGVAITTWFYMRQIQPSHDIFWLSAVVPLADLGQREHYVLMFGLPYAGLIARRASGAYAASRPVPRDDG